MIMTLLEPLQAPPASSYPVMLLGSMLNRCIALLPSAAQLDLLSSHTYKDVIWSYVHPSCLHHDTVQLLGIRLAPIATGVLVKKHSMEERVSVVLSVVSYTHVVVTGGSSVLGVRGGVCAVWCLMHMPSQVAALCCLIAVVSSGEVQGEILSKILLETTAEDISHCHELSLYLLSGLLSSLPPANASEVS